MRKIPGAAFLVFLIAGCFLLTSCGKPVYPSTPTQEKIISKTPDPSLDIGTSATQNNTSSLDATPNIETTPTIYIDENRFVSIYCPISLRQFVGWSITEIMPGDPGSRSISGSTIELLKDQYSLAIICFYQSGGRDQSPGGRGAGEPVSFPEIQIIDKLIPGQGTVWEGATVSVLYSYNAYQLSIFADIGQNPYTPISASNGKFNIPPEVINEVNQILESISLTEPIDIFIPTPPADDPQVILQMADHYYSQLDDIDLPNACAPTAGFIILDYLKKETTLDEVAELLMMIEPESGGYDPTCKRNIVCTSPMTLAQRISSEYFLTIHTRQGWTLESVHQTLLRGHPIIADILWRLDGQSIGHFVVIFGIDIENKLIYYHDPIDGENQLTSWQEFSERWAGPVDVGDPTYIQGFRYWGMEVFSEDWEDELSN